MNQEEWDSTSDPAAMLRYLEGAGCYLEFEPFFMNCFDRIRPELKTSSIEKAVYDSTADVDELMDSARIEIDTMVRRLSAIDANSKDWIVLSREIYYSKAVLAREYHDFGESIRFLSGYLIEIADDDATEAKKQVEFLRSNFTFPYASSNDDVQIPMFNPNHR